MKPFIFAIALLFSINMHAAGLKAEDIIAIDVVVGQLIESVTAGDGEVAFALHTNWARSTLRNPNNFMHVLREDYPGIYYGVSYNVVSVVQVEDVVKVTAYLTDREGDSYITVFDFKFEERWKIDDCAQKREKGKSI